MKQEIKTRLSFLVVFAVLLTTVGITCIYYSLFQRQVRSDLRLQARLLRDAGVFEELRDTGGTDLAKRFHEIGKENLRITWIDQDGTVLYDNDWDESALENHNGRPEIRRAFAVGTGESIRKSDTLNRNTFYYALRLSDGTVLRVASEAGSFFSVLLTALPILAAVLCLTILLCVWVSRVLTKQLIVPMEKMAENLEEGIDGPLYPELIPFADKIKSQHAHILAAAKARQDFTANVSHELKTPLTAISGYAELIENKMTEPGQELYFAKQIRKNSDRLVSVINDIIRLAELDHKEAERKMEYVDLYEIVKECAETLRINAAGREVALRVDAEHGEIYANVEMIRELVWNLVQNGILYNNPGGHVSVFAGREEGRMALHVKDDGIGIPKEMQERVFERFYRVDKSRSRETGGTGLGLAIVKHIVEIHGAEIALTGELGKGTDVVVRF